MRRHARKSEHRRSQASCCCPSWQFCRFARHTSAAWTSIWQQKGFVPDRLKRQTAWCSHSQLHRSLPWPGSLLGKRHSASPFHSSPWPQGKTPAGKGKRLKSLVACVIRTRVGLRSKLEEFGFGLLGQSADIYIYIYAYIYICIYIHIMLHIFIFFNICSAYGLPSQQLSRADRRVLSLITSLCQSVDHFSYCNNLRLQRPGSQAPKLLIGVIY